MRQVFEPGKSAPICELLETLPIDQYSLAKTLTRANKGSHRRQILLETIALLPYRHYVGSMMLAQVAFNASSDYFSELLRILLMRQTDSAV